MMMAWERPRIEVEKFIANDYVAACGDSGTVYYFECNAGNKWNSYNVYFDDGTPLASSDWDDRGQKFSGYHPCGSTHRAESNSGFYDGYMYLQTSGLIGGGQSTGERIDVIIWTENNTDVHCTTDLDMSTWETEKS